MQKKRHVKFLKLREMLFLCNIVMNGLLFVIDL
jgi:hypothetical protein